MMRREPRFIERKREYEENVLEINRISRTVSGGRRIRFRVLIVIGDRKGKVGIGVGKAPDIAEAVKKARLTAEKHLMEIPLKNGTIPSEIRVNYGASKIVLKPARPGTSIIAGSAVRSIVNLSGIENISTKILGSDSKINNAKAMMVALKKLKEVNERIQNRRNNRPKVLVSEKELENEVSKDKK